MMPKTSGMFASRSLRLQDFGSTSLEACVEFDGLQLLGSLGFCSGLSTLQTGHGPRGLEFPSLALQSALSMVLFFQSGVYCIEPKSSNIHNATTHDPWSDACLHLRIV